MITVLAIINFCNKDNIISSIYALKLDFSIWETNFKGWKNW